MHGRKHAEIGRRQQARIDATPEMEDLEDGHKTMDTPPMGGEVEYDDRKEAGPTLPPASVREQIVNANRGMVEERRALLDGAVANNKNINTNEFSESEEDEEDGRKMGEWDIAYFRGYGDQVGFVEKDRKQYNAAVKHLRSLASDLNDGKDIQLPDFKPIAISPIIHEKG